MSVKAFLEALKTGRLNEWVHRVDEYFAQFGGAYMRKNIHAYEEKTETEFADGEHIKDIESLRTLPSQPTCLDLPSPAANSLDSRISRCQPTCLDLPPFQIRPH